MKANTINAVARRVVSHALDNVARMGILAASALVFAGLLVLVPGEAIAQGKTIVILAPHPDDETLCCTGVIYDALQQGNTVKIVVVTNGDSYETGTSFGYLRQAESVAGMALMGVSEQNIIFMGYGDQALQSLYQSTSPATVITSAAGQTQTYANRGLGGVSYHQYLYGAPGLYNRQTILGDMEAMLQNLQPSDVYTTSLWDDHPDHAGTFQFVVEALLALRRQGVPLSTRVHETFIHAPCASCGTPNNAAYLWPGGGVGVQPVFTPTIPYAEPYYLENIWPNGGNMPYSWNQIENLPVPAPMQNTVQSDNLKAQVISQYPSETDIPNGYLFSFAKRNEFFWIRDFSTNLAGLATVSVSSETPSSGQLGTSAVDGFIQGYPGYAPWEWATQGELAGAWINLNWPTPVTISQVVLYNRQDLVDDVLSGTLSFSDGTTVPVGQLPINGNAFLVSFAPKTVTSMKFTVDDAVGQNIGLTEMEVYGKLAGTTANHPQIYQGPVASAPYQTDAYGQKLTPSITDAQTTNLSVVAFDVDAQPLSYTWTSDSGAVSGTGSAAVFNPPVVPVPTVVTATVTVSNGQGGTAQNSTLITVTPSNTSGISVSSLAVNPTSIASGSPVVGTVTLNQMAPQGAVVLLASANPAIATVPSTVVVAPGSSSASFPVSTSYVASTTLVTISASLGGVTQNASLQVLQPPVTVSSFTFNPATVGGGNSSTGTVTLSGPALAGGAVVTLTSNSPSVATVPASVTIPPGATSSNFAATTQALTSAVSVTVSARYVGQTTNASLRVAPIIMPNLATLATVSVSSESTATQQLGIKAIDGIVDGAPGDYTKEWATNGQLAGAWIKLTWSLPVSASQVTLYDRPNLTENVTSGTISFSDGTTVPVGSLPNDGAPLVVSFAGRTITWMQFTVNTAVGQNIGLAEIAVNGTINQASTVTAVTVTPTSVTGGLISTGTVFLDGVAPSGGTAVTLASSDTSTATVPASVTVPSGSLTTTFPITTSSVSAATGVVISGTYNGTQGATLTVNPAAISSLSLNPTMVAGGTTSPTGTITLTGPAPPSGVVVTLTSSDISLATVPASVTVLSGATTGTFAVTTTTANTASRVTISAMFNGTQSAVLWVTPVITNSGQMQQFVIDTFNRSDGSLGSDWSTILDSPSVPLIASQQIQSSYVYSTALFYGGINWPADQYAQAQIVQSNGGSTGPAVRMTSTGNYYAGTVGSFGNGNASVYIILDSRTNRSILASSSTAAVLPNDYLQLSVQGTTITLTNVTQSATLLTVTDSTLPAGYPGLYVGSGGSLANWSAGLTTPPSTLATLASDDFNRANAPNLGSNWAVGPGLFPIQIVNDQIESGGQGQPAGAGHGKEYYTAAPFSSDQWSQAQVVSSNNDINGALVRYQGSSDTHYVAFVSMLGPGGTCSVGIDKDTNGNPVVLATDSTNCAVAPGDVVRFQAQGPLLSYIDVTTGTLLLSTFDTEITGGSPGWSLNPIGGTPTAANWSGGQFGAPAPPGVLSLILSPANVEGGNTAQGTVTLTNPATGGGTVVSLTSSDTATAMVPASVTVPSGSTSATFTVNTTTVASGTPVSISASYGSTSQSGTLTVSPQAVSSLTLAPGSVLGGTSSTATVTLAAPAPAGGAVITLSSSDTSAAQVPATVTVAANATTATFSVDTSPVASDAALTISATYGSTQSASLTVTAAALNSVSVSPASVSGGSSSTGTVTLSGPAPAGGAVVALASSDTAAAQVPASVTVAANATTATFTITTSPVASDAALTISATYGSTQNAGFTVTAAVLNSVSVNPASVQGGASSTGTVTLSGPAPAGGAVVALASSDTAAAQVSASVTVAANATTATFTITTSPVASDAALTISGSYGGTQTTSLTVTAAVLNSVSVNPASVVGGSSSTGTVTLSGPAATGGVVVTLSSSDTAAAQVPASVTVAANATTATFSISSDPVASDAALTISATYGSTQTAGFTVTAAVVNSVSLNPTSVLGGSSSTGTVTLNGPAPTAGAVVTLTSSDTAAAQVPANVTVAANATTATFQVTSSPVASNTSLTISGTRGSTQNASLTVTAPVLNAVSVSPASVQGGGSSTGTVTISGPAPAGGAVVTLSNSDTAAAQVPASVTVAANATTATFTITTSPVASDAALTISGSYGGTQTTAFTVTAAVLNSVSVNPASVQGGTSSTGTVTLSGPAPAGGAVVTLSSSDTAAAQVPGSVTVAANATTATFTVTTSPVSSDATLNISATRGATQTASFTVTAPPITVSSVTLNPTSVVGGSSSTGTVTLSGPAAAGGVVVTLSSSDTAAAQVPASVTVAANATTATFSISSDPVASDAALTISATYGSTQTAGFTVTAAVVNSVSLNPTSVLGGSSSTGTVTLNGPAPTAGAVVTLTSSDTAAAQVPANVTVAANATTATFQVTSSPVASNTSLTISGTRGSTQNASLTVTAPVLNAVSVSPASVQGGGSSTGTVTISGPAPAGGAVVTLSNSDTAAAQVPASVTVAANATTATFTITTSPVASDAALTISGSYGGTQTTAFTVTAAVLNSVSVNPASVQGGTSSTGTVTLSGPAPAGGAVVTLSSSDTAAAQVPGSVTVAANATTATFTVTTSPVSSDATLNISATRGATQNASFTVTAAVVSSVTVNPASVLGGSSSTGTVTLSGPAPAGGAVVTLSSSDTAAAQVPASVTVAANATTATFSITSSPVASNTSLTISATYGATQNASFTVTAAVVNSVSVNPASVLGGSSSTGMVTLSGPAPAAGAVVILSSSDTAAAQVPASVTVAANATTATFQVTSSPVASNTSLTISGTYGGTQNASYTVTASVLSSVNLSPASVVAGNSATGTVTLTGPAPAGGAVVALSSNNPAAAQVPASVTVAPNATTATFTVTSSSVAINTSLTISATYGATQTAGFTVVAVVLNTITLNPIPVLGGNSTTGTVTLSSPAPAGGAVVTLSSNKAAVAQVPASVTVAANATTATFPVTTSPVASNTAVTISGTYNATRTVNFTVTAAVLSTIALSPTPVVGGNTTTGTVTLNGRAPAAGAVVTLSSNNTAVAQAPATVTVAANATTATFTVTTTPVASNTAVTISGTYGATRNVSFTVQASVVKSVTTSPTSVLGGNSSTGTVTLSRAAPVGGAVVTLSSSNTAAAQVPASVTVAANATTATFTVTTSPVASNTSPTISATYGVTRTASLTVTAAALSTIALSPTPVIGGNTTTGTVTLTGRAPTGGAVVTLSSNKTGTAQVPASVTVPANATTATFTVTTSPMASNTSVTISATYGVTRNVSFVVQAPTMASLTLNPTTVKGGTPSTGTVTLTGAAPTGGTVVTLSSSRTAVATVPASVTVTAGNTTATFTVTSKAVATNNSITITATRSTASTAVLLVTP